jgi:hypothetical protein
METSEKPVPKPGSTIEERLIEAAKERASEGYAESGPIEWAYWLEKALTATYTGDNKVDLIRDARYQWYYSRDNRNKPSDHPDRQLTSEQAIQVLRQGVIDGRCSQTTVDKAITLMNSGTWAVPPQLAPHLANSLPPPPKGAKAPARELVDLVTSTTAKNAAPEIETIGPKQVAKAVPPAPKGRRADGPKLPHELAREALSKGAAVPVG